MNTNQLMNVLKVGTKIAVGGPATAGARWGASALLGKIMTDPQAAATAVKVLPARYLPAVIRTGISASARRCAWKGRKQGRRCGYALTALTTAWPFLRIWAAGRLLQIKEPHR